MAPTVTVPDVFLHCGPDAGSEVEALAASCGGRVGLDGVLADLDRVAEPAYPGRSLASAAFALDARDQRSHRWWPQGVTCSADAGPGVAPEGRYAGRPLLLTTAYAKPVGGVHQGCRVTVHDLSEPTRVRSRHLLAVRPVVDAHGRPGIEPVPIHAGGIVWRDGWVHLAATGSGLVSARLADVVAVDPAREGAFGHRYLLPVRRRYRARTGEGVEPVRYSFLSLTHPDGDLLAGEYGHGTDRTRLLRFGLSADGLPATGSDGLVRPREVADAGVTRMQGAVEVDGVQHLSTSNGRRGHGSLWTGRPGDFRRHRHALPPGPEDLCAWPSEGLLWTVTEYPHQRFLLAVPRDRIR